jgi:hypothetical protein
MACAPRTGDQQRLTKLLLRTASYPYPNRHSARAAFPWLPLKLQASQFTASLNSLIPQTSANSMKDYSLHRITISINELTEISEFADQ